jgi:hypothetical protein
MAAWPVQVGTACLHGSQGVAVSVDAYHRPSPLMSDGRALGSSPTSHRNLACPGSPWVIEVSRVRSSTRTVQP